MVHTSLDVLSSNLKAAADKVAVGAYYAHYKHLATIYVVTGLAILEATDEVAVRYALISDVTVEFIRPLNSWLQYVEHGGQSVARFTRVD